VQRPQRPTAKRPAPKAGAGLTKLLILLEQWTRADVASRLGVFDLMAICATVKLEKEDEIRVLLYGTCCLAALAKKFGIIRGETKSCQQ